MIEDKQIYTTARSEQIKRQIKAFLKKVNSEVEKYQKKRKEKIKEKAVKEKIVPSAPAPATPQNIKLTVDITPKTAGKTLKTEYRQLESKPVFKQETLYAIITYSLLFAIIFIIALSIYFTTKK